MTRSFRGRESGEDRNLRAADRDDDAQRRDDAADTRDADAQRRDQRAKALDDRSRDREQSLRDRLWAMESSDEDSSDAAPTAPEGQDRYVAELRDLLDNADAVRAAGRVSRRLAARDRAAAAEDRRAAAEDRRDAGADREQGIIENEEIHPPRPS